MPGPGLLSTEDVTVTRGSRAVVEGVSVALGAGRVVALVGPNGAGKSSLLGALGGTLPCTGRITLDGVDVRGLAPAARARAVAGLGQSESPDPDLSALEVVLLGRAPHLGAWGLPADEDIRAARSALADVDAVSLESRRVGTLSGGELQRVLLARALCTGARVLLLDEPTSALDLRHAHAVLALLRRVAATGALVVVVMHDLSLAARCADEMILLHHGRVLARGAPRDVLSAEFIQQAWGVRSRVVDVDGQPLVAVLG